MAHRILFLPHFPGLNVRVRSYELARCLADAHTIHYLCWPVLRARAELLRAWHGVRCWARPLRVRALGSGVHELRASRLLLKGSLAQAYNRYQLARWIAELDIDVVVSADFRYTPFPHWFKGRVVYVYDMVDAFWDERRHEAAHIRKFVGGELAKADVVTVCSRRLAENVRRLWGREVEVLPNGADLAELRAVAPEDVTRLRASLGLEGRWVIGSIGNHGPWSGLELLLGAFQRIRARMPEVALLIVGPGSEVDRLSPRYERDPDVCFTGPRPPEEMPLFFNALDVGTLPFEVSEFTHSALPLKVIEYSACNKPVVSTPLRGVMDLAFPNIRLAESDVEAWAAALLAARTHSWDRHDLACSVEAYDWHAIAGRLLDAIESRGIL
ncbi:MAG: glycosyltransferase [Anaerolineae bacterium]